MPPEKRAAAPIAVGSSGGGDTYAMTEYRNRPELATAADYATTKVAKRFRLTISTARLVCQLSGVGGGHV